VRLGQPGGGLNELSVLAVLRTWGPAELGRRVPRSGDAEGRRVAAMRPAAGGTGLSAMRQGAMIDRVIVWGAMTRTALIRNVTTRSPSPG
jgi:hypothetical protein